MYAAMYTYMYQHNIVLKCQLKHQISESYPKFIKISQNLCQNLKVHILLHKKVYLQFTTYVMYFCATCYTTKIYWDTYLSRENGNGIPKLMVNKRP